MIIYLYFVATVCGVWFALNVIAMLICMHQARKL
jgi:hypothetical protein